MKIGLENNKIKIAHYFFWLAVIATIFVAYGSMIPFVYRAYTFQESLNLFAKIPYLSLGEASRADWFANAIIYIPISFAWCGYFSTSHRKVISYNVLIILLVLMAVIIEYLQIFIAPRTVSLNDLIAEIIGILIGVGLWLGSKEFMLTHLEQLYRTQKVSVHAILIIYVTGYVLFSLFPYDFYFSGAELSNAFENKGLPLFGYVEGQKLGLKMLALWMVKLLVVLPLGYLYMTYKGPDLPPKVSLISISLLLFLMLEVAQYFTVSGNSSFWSVIIIFIGFYGGVECAKRWSLRNIQSHTRKIRAVIYLGMLPFIFFVLGLRGLSLSPEGSFSAMMNQLEKISFIPFYYHYFTTEVHALLSLMAQILLVGPVGILLALHDWGDGKGSRHAWWNLLIFGALFSLFFEAVGLYWSNLKPDPTNILIGGVGVIIIYKSAIIILNSLAGVKGNDFDRVSEEVMPPQKTLPRKKEENRTIGLVPLAALIGAFIYIYDYPLSKTLLLLGCISYGALLYYRPYSWLIVITASLPILDLYPISGRFFMTEFDFLILVTLAVKYGLGHVSYRFLKKDLHWILLLGGVGMIYFLSTLRVLWPLPDIDLNSFNSYYSEYNSLRIMKGFIWSILLLPVLEYDLRKDVLSFIRLSYGMIIGLIIVCLVVVLERELFVGLFNFSSNQYRVTGSFASMHTGGSHIDSYLVTMLPFIAIPVLLNNRFRNIILYSVLLLLAFYTIFVTYSRGPYLIVAAVAVLLVGGMVLSSYKKVKKRYTIMMSFGFLTLVATWIAIPLFYETILSERLENIEQDQQTRLSHWNNSLQGANFNFSDFLLGHGPGSFPRNTYINKTINGHKISVHNLLSEDKNVFLRMNTGDQMYTSQFVAIDPAKKYKIRFKVRSPGNTAQLTTPLCERWITDPFRCVWMSFNLKLVPGEWLSVERDIDMAAFQERIFWFEDFIRRPVTLSAFTLNRRGPVDIDDVEVLDSGGRNLVMNGDFEQGKDFWFFVVDNHLLWHTKNLAVNIIYDLGVLGLVFIGGMLLLTIVRLIRMIFAGEQMAAVLLASISGYIGVGIVGSLFDVPQLSFLLFFLICVIMILWHEFSEQKPSG